MADAPTPGHTSKRAKRKGFRVTLYGERHELHLRDVGPGDAGLVRQTTGRPLNTYLNDYDLDSMAVILWLARRKAGERKLTLAKVFDTFPNWEELNEMMEDGRADFEVLEDLDDEDDVDEVEPHPLSSAAS
jgi:hypothetical protein